MPEDYRGIQEGLTNYVKIGTVIFLTLAGLFIFFIALSIQRRRRMFLEQKEMKIKFEQELLQTQIEIQEQTLKTISEEIHDNVGQVLSLAKLNLNTLDNAGDKKIKDTKNLVAKAINDLRNLSRSIHGDRIAELGLQQSVEDELSILQNSGQFTTALQIHGAAYKLTPQKEMVLFRIVQEALNNAVKYSKAKNITVLIEYRQNDFCITVEDDGCGFDLDNLPAAKTGIGLNSMKSRAALIGGIYNIQSALSKGTSISVTLAKE